MLRASISTATFTVTVASALLSSDRIAATSLRLSGLLLSAAPRTRTFLGRAQTHQQGRLFCLNSNGTGTSIGIRHLSSMASPSSGEQSATTRAPPAGYRVHREGTTEILTHDGSDASAAADAELTSAGQKKKQVFINPIQEFNRDISIVALRAWSELVAEEKREARSKKQQRNNGKPKDTNKQKRLQEDEGEPSSKRRKVQDVEVGGVLQMGNLWCSLRRAHAFLSAVIRARMARQLLLSTRQ